MKRKTIAVAIVTVLIILIAMIAGGKMLTGFIFAEGFDILIENHTNAKISGLKITYMNAVKDVEVPTIEANSAIKLNVNPREDFGENSMKLYYFEKSGLRHEETIVGYFEKGYRGKSKVEIKNIDAAGKLTLQVKEIRRYFII